MSGMGGPRIPRVPQPIITFGQWVAYLGPCFAELGSLEKAYEQYKKDTLKANAELERGLRMTDRATLEQILDEDPHLVRAIEDLCRTPQFLRVKRFVVATYQDQGEEAAGLIAESIGISIADTALSFGPDGT